ncbi:TonB-dependent receptor [Pontibacter sp. 13R65]|uniref:SusC/RagA family TonB-linked outer membrane protein n=1 Tax=Pontibacter sp. 13R65 TaxID=3127458 RepID=UPI00301B89CA
MKQRFLLLLLMCSLFIGISDAWAQAIDVAGTVKDSETGEPIPGVSIVVKGTSVGTITGVSGEFKLQVPEPKAILVFSFLSYTMQEVPLQGRSTLDISLKPDSKVLDEVVVIGYGTVKKSDLTGAVSSVRTEDMLKTLPTSVNQALQGQVAGVMVNRGDGAPGAGVNITIRGTNSFSGSEPLYVVDGIPFTSAATPKAGTEDNMQAINALSFLNPQDIESMEILKDASATAIYGSRGANGVVLITTKKGKAGKDKVEFISNFSLSEISKRVETLNAYQYAQFQNEAFANFSAYEGTALSVPFPGTVGVDQATGLTTYRPKPEDFLNGMPEGSTIYPVGFTGTNWQDQIFRTATMQDYTLRVSGGNEKGAHSISGNYVDQQGIINNSGYKRYGVQFNLNRKVGKLLDIGTNNNISYTQFKFGKTNSSGAQPSLISSTLLFAPTFPADNDEFSVLREQSIAWMNIANPYKTTTDAKDETFSTRVSTSAYAQVNISQDLNFRQRMGYNYNTNTRETYYGRDLNEGRAPVNGRASSSTHNNGHLVLESIMSYNKTFGQKHNINAVGAYSYEEGNSTYQDLAATNFPTDITKNFDLRAGLNPAPISTGRDAFNLMSVLGRVNYSFDGRYLLTASFRRDGSSKFAEKNKWANFSSFAAAWNAGNEAFIQNLNIFSNLKVRASYGQTGNQGIGPYGSMYRLAIANVPINGKEESGYVVNHGLGLVDPNIRWETTSQYNAGIDMGFAANRFNLTVDVYHKRTEDLLQRIQIANSTGFGVMLTNYGTVENKGLEITGQGILHSSSNFTWDVNANISWNRNKIMDLPADQFAQRLWHSVDNVFIQRNGQPIGAVYGLVEDGYYDNLAEVMADPQFANLPENVQRTKIGEIKYKNMDDDPTSISETTDRVIIGNTNPNYTFGITNNLTYKKFTLSVFFQGVVGGDIVNTNLLKVRMSQNGNIPQFAYDTRWTPETAASAEWPKANASSNRIMLFSDRYLEDATYVRLKNINLNYSFKVPYRFIESINVYGSVSNLLTFSNYSWYDPDVNSFGGDASRRGVDMNSYPNARTFTLGLRAVIQ